MSVAISGSGTITGLTATGISAQPVFPGNILQVVNATYSTEATRSSSTYADTGLTASITPSSNSSKILALVNMAGLGKTTNETYVRLQLLRGASVLALFEAVGGATATSATNYFGSSSICYLDSPATTSSTTYKVQFMSNNNVASVVICGNNCVSTMTLLEVAA